MKSVKSTKDLIVLLAAESLNAPELIESDEVVNQIKSYLNNGHTLPPPKSLAKRPRFLNLNVRFVPFCG
jgi:hypothetical protein